ncbi:hypothetical protein BH24PSE1_BH24PSE1_01880 [soil metagenome]
MASLSISRAWDESKARIAADGRLMLVVAAALIALPAIVAGVVTPAAARSNASLADWLLLLAVSLIAVVGQLAIIRLALGTSVSVGEAIGHGARRMPIYFIAGIIIIGALLLALIPIALVLMASGVPMDERSMASSPVSMLLLLLYLTLVLFVGIRMLMSSPVASEEAAGPIAILQRSWELTSGNWWRLLGFIILFLIGIGILMAAIGWAAAIAAELLFGPVEPMSASALLVAVVEATVQAAVSVVLAVMLARIYVQLSGNNQVDVSVPKSGT